ncbi:MAG: hypothetical protein LBK99_16245, partial [Opitutaceae bacterium]|nr:hypothetical protein [Opitutaceae bacterium]
LSSPPSPPTSTSSTSPAKTALAPTSLQPISSPCALLSFTRQLALLRAHGLLKKVSGTHRWLLTDYGRRIVTAFLVAHQADVDQLSKMAA